MDDEVITDVDDTGQLCWIDDVAERPQESSGTDATTENADHLRNLRGAWVTSRVVSEFPGVDRWPGDPSLVLFRLVDGVEERIACHGPVAQVRPWASVSKMVVSMACAVEFDWGLHDFEERMGPRGATLANLLSHSSGLGLEEGDRVVGVATRRVYSNYAVDLAVQAIVGTNPPSQWLDDRIFRTLGMSSTSLEGRPSSGVIGSTHDDPRGGVAAQRRTRSLDP